MQHRVILPAFCEKARYTTLCLRPMPACACRVDPIRHSRPHDTMLNDDWTCSWHIIRKGPVAESP